MDSELKNPVLELRNIDKKYDGKSVVHDLSLSVHPGEVVGLLGCNGAGKTTCLLYTSPSPRD